MLYGGGMETKTSIEWCIVSLKEDMNWWVEEMSQTPAIELDERISILDPKQVEFMLDLLDTLRPYGLQEEIVEQAFIPFAIDKDLGGGRVRLVASDDKLMSSEEKLFALPNVFDESYGGYAEFIDHITALRVKMLNATCHFQQKLTVDELEDATRDALENTEISELPTHLFQEILTILEYCPAGYEDDLEDDDEAHSLPEDEENWENTEY